MIPFVGTIRKQSRGSYGVTIPLNLIRARALISGEEYRFTVSPVEPRTAEVEDNDHKDLGKEESAPDVPSSASEEVRENQEPGMDRNSESPGDLEGPR